MQERRRAAVLTALLPLAIGHALAIAAAVALALAMGAVIPMSWLRWPVAGLLIALGTLRVFRHTHPRWASMRVSSRRLMLWSFLMATAHGAGLMVVPVFMGMGTATAGEQVCHGMAGASLGAGPAVVATVLHAIGYLAVTAVVAIAVFEKLGVGLLRTAWVNLDLVWAAALVLTGALTLFVR
jgi:hypothetical protein